MSQLEFVENGIPHRVINVGCHHHGSDTPTELDEFGRSVNTPGCEYCANLVLYGGDEACPKCGTTGPLNL